MLSILGGSDTAGPDYPGALLEFQNNQTGNGILDAFQRGDSVQWSSASGVSGLFQTSTTDGSNANPTLVAKLNTAQTAPLIQLQDAAGTNPVDLTNAAGDFVLSTGAGTERVRVSGASGQAIFTAPFATININATEATSGTPGLYFVGTDSASATTQGSIGLLDVPGSVLGLSASGNGGLGGPLFVDYSHRVYVTDDSTYVVPTEDPLAVFTRTPHQAVPRFGGGRVGIRRLSPAPPASPACSKRR